VNRQFFNRKKMTMPKTKPTRTQQGDLEHARPPMPSLTIPSETLAVEIGQLQSLAAASPEAFGALGLDTRNAEPEWWPERGRVKRSGGRRSR